jgi:hypothetical protein
MGVSSVMIEILQTIKLAENCSIQVGKLPDGLSKLYTKNFDSLGDNKLETQNSVLVLDKETNTYYEKQIYRKYKSFMSTPPFDPSSGKSYMFSGSTTDSTITDDLPDVFSPVYDLVDKLDSFYNQCVINWYDTTDHISMHSDCEHAMIPNADICVVSLTNSPHGSVFILEAKDIDSVYLTRVTIPLDHGTVLIMKGATQKLFRHGVPSSNTNQSRISVTFRQMKEVQCVK